MPRKQCGSQDFPMDIEQLRQICLAFPAVTEQIQWGDNLLFKVAGKMFAITSLEPSPVWLSLKVTPEDFAELTERPNVIPAPYLARAKWIALESSEALGPAELASLLRTSYDLVVAKLPRKTRDALAKDKTCASASRPAPHKHTRLKSRARKKRRK
jgi:predicted DNA-binding protein (MmcQ/YjbR family)